eukprot:CAMPEP_0194130094 /NCGR_PEP_ID=MMETSP0152-20130528/1235_1 /TAXON_ID=1049557 /ORGANISM="Thalassiothrix antarctica, Strain L6-D1" /LENGTH=413 /DNA_ID=CAMNT_0038824515 /DNA_START=197 /DNA_END=1441 /DNA_ORIENTATION=+
MILLLSIRSSTRISLNARAFQPIIRHLKTSALVDTSKGPDQNTSPLSTFTSVQQQYKLLPTVPDVIPLEKEQRLVCIGDVHGDIHAFKKFLHIAGVFDGTRWIGGNTILVQCGDVLDRGTEELECFSLISNLSQQASAQGGSLICLWGNHEALNAAGLFHYASGDEEYEENVGKSLDLSSLDTNRWRIQFGGNHPERWASYEPGGILALPLLMHLKVAVKVGNTVCVHAGLTQKHLNDYGGLEGMNIKARNWIEEAHHHQNNNLGDYETVEQVLKEAENRAKLASSAMPECLGGGNSASSPVWMRNYSYPPNVVPKQLDNTQILLDEVLQTLGADRMVVGHTVQSQINAVLEGKAWRIDVGASRGVSSGRPEVLEIVKDRNGQESVSILTNRGKVSQDQRQINEETNLMRNFL